MKKLLGALCVLIILGIAWYILTDGAMTLRAAKEKIVRNAQDAVVSAVDPDEVAALAMKAINMTQGEHGAELWRLKADWGNVRRKDNVMELEKPRFTYYMPPDNVPIHIASDVGEIEQDQQRIQFIDSVVATYDDRVLKAPVMEYFGKNGRRVFCPKGGTIEGVGYEGSADTITWFLNDKIIEAVGNVVITFESDKDIFAPRQSSEKAQTPNAADPGPAQPQG